MTFLPDSECHHMEICSHTEGCRKDDVLMSYLLIPAVSSVTLPPPLPFPWTANVIAFQQHCEQPGPSATLESLQRAKSWLFASNYLVFSLEKKEGNTNQGTDAARLSSWNEASIPCAIRLPRLSSCQGSAGHCKPGACLPCHQHCYSAWQCSLCPWAHSPHAFLNTLPSTQQAM